MLKKIFSLFVLVSIFEQSFPLQNIVNKTNKIFPKRSCKEIPADAFFYHATKYIDMKTFLNLRLVSKNLCQQIEALLKKGKVSFKFSIHAKLDCKNLEQTLNLLEKFSKENFFKLSKKEILISFINSRSNLLPTIFISSSEHLPKIINAIENLMFKKKTIVLKAICFLSVIFIFAPSGIISLPAFIFSIIYIYYSILEKNLNLLQIWPLWSISLTAGIYSLSSATISGIALVRLVNSFCEQKEYQDKFAKRLIRALGNDPNIILSFRN